MIGQKSHHKTLSLSNDENTYKDIRDYFEEQAITLDRMSQHIEWTIITWIMMIASPHNKTTPFSKLNGSLAWRKVEQKVKSFESNQKSLENLSDLQTANAMTLKNNSKLTTDYKN